MGKNIEFAKLDIGNMVNLDAKKAYYFLEKLGVEFETQREYVAGSACVVSFYFTDGEGNSIYLFGNISDEQETTFFWHSKTAIKKAITTMKKLEREWNSDN